ncbi:MAG: hypothetical protein KR126chlam3_00326 [Chlamydiae bacterium]|nr:hypothetical protein [Chlamydiota bacterium]
MATGVGVDLASVLLKDLYSESRRREEKLEEEFGTSLCKTLGYDTIDEIPIVRAIDLGLDNEEQYHPRTVHPASLGEEIIVRGKDGWNRPFIALKCDVLDAKLEKVAELVEIIYKRFPLDGFGGKGKEHENSYVSGFNNIDSKGQEHFSVMPATIHVQETINLFKRIINGEILQSPPFSIRRSKKV